jgi:hypothetical protein
MATPPEPESPLTDAGQPTRRETAGGAVTARRPDADDEPTDPHRSRSPLALRISYLAQIQRATHQQLDSLLDGNASWRARALATIPAALVHLDPGGYAELLRSWIRFDAPVAGELSLVEVARRRRVLRGVTGAYAERAARAPWTVVEVKQVIGLDGITAEDVLTGERHFIADRDAARCAEPRRLVLVRPVRLDGTSTLEGRSDVVLPRAAKNRLRAEIARRMGLNFASAGALRGASPDAVRDAMVVVAREHRRPPFARAG